MLMANMGMKKHNTQRWPVETTLVEKKRRNSKRLTQGMQNHLKMYIPEMPQEPNALECKRQNDATENQTPWNANAKMMQPNALQCNNP